MMRVTPWENKYEYMLYASSKCADQLEYTHSLISVCLRHLKSLILILFDRLQKVRNLILVHIVAKADLEIVRCG